MYGKNGKTRKNESLKLLNKIYFKYENSPETMPEELYFSQKELCKLTLQRNKITDSTSDKSYGSRMSQKLRDFNDNEATHPFVRRDTPGKKNSPYYANPVVYVKWLIEIGFLSKDFHIHNTNSKQEIKVIKQLREFKHKEFSELRGKTIHFRCKSNMNTYRETSIEDFECDANSDDVLNVEFANKDKFTPQVLRSNYEYRYPDSAEWQSFGVYE